MGNDKTGARTAGIFKPLPTNDVYIRLQGDHSATQALYIRHNGRQRVKSRKASASPSPGFIYTQSITNRTNHVVKLRL